MIDLLASFVEEVKSSSSFEELKQLCCESEFVKRLKKDGLLIPIKPTFLRETNGTAIIYVQERSFKDKMVKVNKSVPFDLALFRVLKFLYNSSLDSSFVKNFEKFSDEEKLLLCHFLYLICYLSK